MNAKIVFFMNTVHFLHDQLLQAKCIMINHLFLSAWSSKHYSVSYKAY